MKLPMTLHTLSESQMKVCEKINSPRRAWQIDAASDGSALLSFWLWEGDPSADSILLSASPAPRWCLGLMPHVWRMCLQLVAALSVSDVCLSKSLFFSFFFLQGLCFYTESGGSPSKQSVITLTQKPQPDHQSAATTAAAAMVRHEISFKGKIFTWYYGPDTRCSRGDKKCVRLLGRTLITLSWVVGL